jgi:uncharacterized membrane protein
MIQRIQTLWFIASSLLAGLLIPGSFLNFSVNSGTKFLIGFSGILKSEQVSQILITRLYPVSIIILMILGLSIISIFLFKKRNIQKVFAIAIILLACILVFILGYSSYKLIRDFNAEFEVNVKMIIPVIIPIVAFLAYRGISKDEALVKSYDRLR